MGVKSLPIFIKITMQSHFMYITSNKWLWVAINCALFNLDSKITLLNTMA